MILFLFDFVAKKKQQKIIQYFATACPVDYMNFQPLSACFYFLYTYKSHIPTSPHTYTHTHKLTF